MEKQPELNEKMREILVDWLEDVTVKFRLLNETLFMAINLMDRFMGIKPVKRNKLQLLGISCLFIASKYEEIYPPHIKEYLRVCDKAYSKNELLEMEANVINSLEFNLTFSSSLRFLERFGLVSELKNKEFMFSRFLIELALMEYKVLKYRNSLIAASAVYLVLKIFRNQEWSKFLKVETGYSQDEVRICAKDLYILLYKSDYSKFSAVRRKFSSKKFLEVSKYHIEFKKPLR